jgi:hypothetical protein
MKRRVPILAATCLAVVASSFAVPGSVAAATNPPAVNTDIQTIPGPQAPPKAPAHLPAALARILAGLPKPTNAVPSSTTSAAPAASMVSITPNNGVAGGGDFTCNQTWEWIANDPAGYVIGNCQNGAHLHRTEYDENIGGYNWDGGQIFGDFGGNCGWLHSDAYVTGGSYSTCSTPSTPIQDFIYQSPPGTYYIWTSSSGTDGVQTNNPSACPEYANFYPWTSSAFEADYTGVTAPANSDRLFIRYLGLYESTDGSGYYVMVRDSSIASGSGNWVFVPATCL